MENINELLVYFSGYFLLIFTQWICDPMKRYEFGWFYINLIGVVVAINAIIILYEMGVGIRKQYRKRQYLKKWTVFYKNSFDRDLSKIDEEDNIKFLENELNNLVINIPSTGNL